MQRICLSSLACSILLFGSMLATSLAGSPEPVLFSGLGPYKRHITTDHPDAQKWFNQGLNWYYSFNFDEAKIAFRKAAEIDPSCAMAWWGLSEAAGPQYNHPEMDQERTELAREAMRQALEHLDGATPAERALVEALQHRNALQEPDAKKQGEQNKLYAAALAEVWASHPGDPDVGAIYANARMTIRPWQLYENATRRPTGDTEEIQGVIEGVLAISPDHPGALHLYIHVTEPSTNPGLALSAADRLSELVPASGHMLHMPTHIYIQTGYWDRAVVQNAMAMGADTAYRARAPHRPGQIGYQIHNAHMLAFAAMMSGRRNEAMAASRAIWSLVAELAEEVPEETLKKEAAWIDTLMGSVYDVHKRFGDWDGLLAEPEPPCGKVFPLTLAIREGARAVAFANKGEIDKARETLEKFKAMKAAVAEDHLFGADPAHQVLDVSLHFLEGEIALNLEDWTAAAEHLKKAIEIEDKLAYTEPPQYLQPTRHALGAVYMRSGDFRKAAQVYQRDLREWPKNVWSLYGRMRALQEQGEHEKAARVERQLERAKEYADFPVDSSCLCLRNL